MKTYIRKFIILALVLVLALGSAVSLSSCSFSNEPPSDDGGEAGGEDLTAQRRAILSTVTIRAQFDTASSTYPYGGQSTETKAGSGVIYKLDKSTGDAYIITNYHVVYYKDAATEQKISQSIKIYLYGLESESYAIEADYVCGSLDYDLAVLKVTDSFVLKETPARAAELGDSEPLRVLDTVITMGNAEGEGFSVTKGIVSVVSENLTMESANGYKYITVRVIRVDAAINGGSSGGGLYDKDGKLVGIVNAKKKGSAVDNIGYAIPINLAVAVVENMLYHKSSEASGVCSYPLGITMSEAERTLELDQNGEIVTKARVAVTAKQEATPFYDFVEVGDSILEITVDGKTVPVTALYHVTETMLWARPGSTVTLVVERGGNTHTATATITAGMGVIVK